MIRTKEMVVFCLLVVCWIVPETVGQCTEVWARGLNDTQKQQIVDMHNEWRNKIGNGEIVVANQQKLQPAKNMNLLKWSDNLAVVAQKVADKCVERHGFPGLREGIEYGQNIGGYDYKKPEQVTTPQIKVFFGDWIKEAAYYNPNEMDNIDANQRSEHFSQVAWANTSEVGCGFSAFKSSVDKEMPAHSMIVCNYFPAGNYKGQAMYDIGKPCSACPGKCTNSKYPNLCVPTEKLKDA